MADRNILLGTKGGPRLTAGSSWPSSSAIEISGRPYVIDCGMGVTRQFGEAGFSLADVDTILVTHLHSDHCLELGPFLHTTLCVVPNTPDQGRWPEWRQEVDRRLPCCHGLRHRSTHGRRAPAGPARDVRRDGVRGRPCLQGRSGRSRRAASGAPANDRHACPEGHGTEWLGGLLVGYKLFPP